jgi:hypothetical protein
MQNLIINRLSIAGAVLMFIGAHQQVFTVGEYIFGLLICFAALTYSLIEG